MNWVEGAHPAMKARTCAQGLTAESLPRRLIPQLADFVYNLTTCPLPASESQNSFRLYILIAVAKLISQTDPSDNNQDKLPTFGTWAKAKLIATRRMLTSNLFPEGSALTGIELFLLLAWVSKQISSLSGSTGYALHHWDLRPVNVVVNAEGNVVAYLYSKTQLTLVL